jgi:GMP synthase (glutamine-hydrolysing)
VADALARSLILLKAGSKLATLDGFVGDYEEWIIGRTGLAREAVQVVRVSEGEPLPPLSCAAAVIITGSSAMVTDQAGWMREGGAWLRDAAVASVPILGICFGHQWLAQVLGGEVGYNPNGVDVGTVSIRLTGAAAEDPLLSGLPAAFSAQATHRQSVVTLPPGATLLATSALEGCQAFRWGERAWGVQFHPEFEAAMMPRFIEHYRRRLLAEGKSPAALERGVGPTPEAALLPGRFARLAGLLA